VSLSLYRETSKLIFNIIHRFCKSIEKGGTDEAFLDVTQEVDFRLKNDPDIDFSAGQGDDEEFW